MQLYTYWKHMEQQPVPKLNKEAFAAILELDRNERSMGVKSGYYRAYALSLLLPPLGVYYFLRFVLSPMSTTDDKKAGVIALVITLISLVASIALTVVLFKQTTTSLPRQTNDVVNELLTPANQKDLKDLLR